MADAKKPASKGAAPAKKGKSYHVYKAYKIEGDKLIRKGGMCPKCEGSLLALHKDRKSCGKCGYMEKLKA
ncbi:30S ribosomal protein S27ae [Candidatus Woesearchaeota archaeon]|nr:30S ribosomal protein S27ae [Candidatus Woesearchaeota archaeon]